MLKELKKAKQPSLLPIVKNPQFDIQVIDNFTAGIVLSGNEIKSIRMHDVSLKEAYIIPKNEEIFIFNMNIALYKNSNASNELYLSRRKRKLLLKKNEIRKLFKFVKEKGFSIIPIRLFINERGWAKIEIVVARKLKKYQLKEKIKEREMQRKIRDNDFS